MSDQLDDLRGALDGRYEIDAEIGRGGMAVVYKARDIKHDRAVALKVLKRDLAETLGADRFLREIQIAASLTHPHVLPLHDSGNAAGFLYYVMPYVGGESLRGRLDRERQIPVTEAVRIAREIAEALDHAHRRDVVHRDIKPENILLEEGHAVVADFGIARAVSAAADDSITQTGISVGTPAYMSPEQVTGESEIDGRSDVYSLGCVLYEMLAGVPPFVGATAQMVMTKRFVEPMPPLTSMRSTIPEELELVVARALATVPADRYPTAGHFAEALGALASVVSGHRTAPSVRARRIVGRKRRRIALWVAGPLAAAVLVLLGVRVLRPALGGNNDRPMLVVLPFENLGAPDDEYFADGITEEITSRLAEIRSIGVIGRTSAIQYKSSNKSISEIGDELKVQYVLEGTVRWQRDAGGAGQVRVTPQLIRVSDETHLWTQRYDAVLEDIFDVQSEIAGQVATALNVTLLDPERRSLESRPTDNVRAYDLYLRGEEYVKRSRLGTDIATAIEMYQRAIALDSNFVAAHARLSQAHGLMYWFGYDQSDERLAQMREEAERAVALGPNVAAAHLAEALYHYRAYRDYASALRSLRQADRLRPDDPDVLYYTGIILRRQGQYAEAIDWFERSLVLNPLAVETLGALAEMHLLQHHFAKGDQACREAIAIGPDAPTPYIFRMWAALSGAGDPDSAIAIMTEGLQTVGGERFATRQLSETSAVNWWLGRILGTRPEFVQMLESVSLPRHDVDSVQYYLARGMTYRTAGRDDASSAYLDSARAVLERRMVTRPDDARTHANLGAVYAATGRVDEALREARRATELLPVSADAFAGPEMIENLALVAAMVGDLDLALDQMERLLELPSRMTPAIARVDPELTAVRHHPRFAQLGG